jgi:hypothetical protein
MFGFMMSLALHFTISKAHMGKRICPKCGGGGFSYHLILSPYFGDVPKQGS